MSQKDKLSSLHKLEGLASATSKALTSVLPGARKVSKEKTEVIAGLFGFFLATVGAALFAAHSQLPLLEDGLLLGAFAGLGLTGGMLVCRLLPDRSRRTQEEARAEISKEISGLEDKIEASSRLAFDEARTEKHRQFLLAQCEEWRGDIARLKQMHYGVLASNLMPNLPKPALRLEASGPQRPRLDSNAVHDSPV